MQALLPTRFIAVSLLLSFAVTACLWPDGLIAQDARGSRNLAKGILRTIPIEGLSGETFSSPRPLVELTVGQNDLNWDPAPNLTAASNTLYAKASRVVFRRQVWNLEFAFKPMRMLQVDVPQPSGKLQQKLIWYLVYRVRYLGQEAAPKPETSTDTELTTFPSVEAKSFQHRRFFPLFILTSHEHKKSYLDRVIPAAKKPILLREFPGKVPGTSSLPAEDFHNTVSITTENILLSSARESHEVWGLITWEDVDPRIDYFSVFVKGLSNAFRFEDPAGAYQAGDTPGTGRKFTHKVLQLNFWRPGDARFEHEKEIRFGVPAVKDPADQQQLLDLYGLPERVDYLWTYR
ncbi:MAG: hypothetical protein CMJ75_14515 [Planctomycetaceae bacterium]|nr:hypothetical protein [Planctomycetaceae bacterium]